MESQVFTSTGELNAVVITHIQVGRDQRSYLIQHKEFEETEDKNMPFQLLQSVFGLSHLTVNIANFCFS